MTSECVEPADGDLNLGGTVADLFGGARFLEHFQDFVAEGEELFPVFFECLMLPGTMSAMSGKSAR